MTSFAIMTPSYAGDFERCRLLCASIDRYVEGHAQHYLMVEDADVALFRRLEGPRRRVVAESELLPSWLKPFANPLPIGPRRLWLSARGWPMRGWHVQQLRKLALPAQAPEDVYLICDSDVVFVRPFDLATLKGPDGLRFFRRKGVIGADMTALGHVDWCEATARLLGLPAPKFPHNDYIDNLVIWDRERVRALQARIAEVSGRDWMSALVRWRTFSEALLYGVFAEHFAPAGLAPTDRPLCHTHWLGERLESEDVLRFLGELAPDQVAIGLQSFIEIPPATLWDLFESRAPLSAPLPAAGM